MSLVRGGGGGALGLAQSGQLHAPAALISSLTLGSALCRFSSVVSVRLPVTSLRDVEAFTLGVDAATASESAVALPAILDCPANIKTCARPVCVGNSAAAGNRSCKRAKQSVCTFCDPT